MKAFAIVAFLALPLLTGCSGDESQEDLAGSVTGSAVEVNCLQRHPQAGVGDTDVAVTCGGNTAEAAPAE